MTGIGKRHPEEPAQRATKDDAAPHHHRKLFGRRKGPKLSAHQDGLLATLLPDITLDLQPGRDPRAYFAAPVDAVWLEVGFGAGEHLLWQAEHHATTGLIGAEPYISGVAKLLSKLSSPACGGGAGEAGGGNLLARIRLYGDDARNILEALPDASLARVFLLFPDPWPKTRHHKRRFVQSETLDQIARVLKQGGEFRFASDDAGYLNWTLERLMAHPAFAWTATCAADWHNRPADWPQTRYEAKELHGPPAFLRFVRH